MKARTCQVPVGADRASGSVETVAAEALIGNERAAIFDPVRPLDRERQGHAERGGTLRVAQQRGEVRGLARAIDAALGIDEGIEAARRRTPADAAVAEIERRRL